MKTYISSAAFGALLLAGCQQQPPAPTSVPNPPVGAGMSGSYGTIPPEAPAPATGGTAPAQVGQGYGAGVAGSPTGTAGGGTAVLAGSTGVVGVEAIAAWDALPATEKDRVKKAKVFFGHQSVGWNTLEGVAALGFTVDEVSTANDYSTPRIGHAYLDSNGEPLRKMQGYADALDRLGSAVNVAAMKLCWIDFDQNTNLGNLESTYQSTIAKVTKAHPNVHLVHVTTPLKTDEPANNAQRLRYGDWLKSTFKSQAIVLDLAAVESTRPDGTAICTNGGSRALCSEYAADEGHLNDTGRARAAKAFLFAVYRSL